MSVNKRGPWWAGVGACGALAAALRLWDLPSTNGIGHVDYSGAAVSMSRGWLAFLTGSVDSQGFVTIEKPAVWLWPSALLIKVFGVNWATLFLPGVLAGVAAVVVLALAVRETVGDDRRGRIIALLAAVGLAVSPISVAIDRVNTPDGMLVLVMLLAAWGLLRAMRLQRLRPLLICAALIGLAFDVKYLAAFIVLPAFVAAVLVSGPGALRRRFGWLLASGGVLLATAAIWPLAVSLIPASRRPWFGGSADGSVGSAVFGTVGLGRVFGQSTPAGTPSGQAGELWNAFQTGLVFHSGRPGPARLVTGVMADQVSWLLPLAVVAAIVLFVNARGLPRTDPAVAGLVLWAGWALCCWAMFSFMRGNIHPYYTNLLAPALVALCALGARVSRTYIVVGIGWAVWVLLRSDGGRPGWLIPVIIACGVLALAGVVIGQTRAAALLLALGVLAGPLVWSIATTTPTLNPDNPMANPLGRNDLAGIPPQAGAALQGALASSRRVDPGLVPYLTAHRGEARWIVATPSVLQAGPLIVTSHGEGVLPLGGFSGADPVPTLAHFTGLVASGQVRYLLVSGADANSTPEQMQASGVDAFGLFGEAARIRAWAEDACHIIDPADYLAAPRRPGSPATVLFDCAG